MKPFILCACAPLLCLLVQGAAAQEDAESPAPPASVATPGSPYVSGLGRDLFYQLLVGEINAAGGDWAAAQSLLLDAARKSGDERLYQRALELALRGRGGEAALQVARAWQRARPQSRSANRALLQVLIHLNRIADTLEAARNEVALAEPKTRLLTITLLPRFYARATDKKGAAAVLEQALSRYLNPPRHEAALTAAAWAAVGQLRLAGGDNTGALEAARRAQAADITSDAAAVLALELIDAKNPQAESIVREHLQSQSSVPVRLAYARVLMQDQRYTQALAQLQRVNTDRPELATPWLALGTLELQQNNSDLASAALRRFIELTGKQPADEQDQRGLAQAYLLLAQIAEKARDFAAAEQWLARIDETQDGFRVLVQRASLLARQGQLDAARALIHDAPDTTGADARRKLAAEIDLLREFKHHRAAYDLMQQALAQTPDDADLWYDAAMLADRLGQYDEMEALLRRLIAARPDASHAYNALGYSLAERGLRLEQARGLIEQALQLKPGDPFITDSLGWVEFRLGRLDQALRLLQQAYASRPDAEIAAHLGEVLWRLQRQDEARAIWAEGLKLNPDNETLLETIRRLRGAP